MDNTFQRNEFHLIKIALSSIKQNQDELNDIAKKLIKNKYNLSFGTSFMSR
jgi:hypothetical protein